MRVKNYYLAKSLQDAYDKLKENPRNAIIAGGLWMKKMGQSYETLIDLSNLNLGGISEGKENIYVGAMTTLREFETSPIINSLFDGVIAFGVREIMGPAFRNMATVGGSIYGRYAFSDLISALLPLDVTVEMFPENKMSLEEFLNFRGKIDGIVTRIVIKREEGKAFFKKAKTTALDFPLINFCIVKRNGKHYISVGSRPAVAALAKNAMAALDKGESFEKAALLAVEELSFADSTLISKEYRQDLAKVYVRRGLEEVNK